LPDVLLPALLDLLPMGVIYYTPLFNAAGEVVDFTFEYLNPAAQRQLQMVSPPAVTFLEQFTEAIPTGAFAFHHTLWAAPEGTTNDYSVSYHADGYDNFFRLNGRRLPQGLLITFTDTADHPRTAAEAALREAQARERNTRHEIEAQRLQVQRLNEELAAANEELAAANEEYQQSNTDLLRAQDFAEHLTNELDARVQRRTHEARAARAAAERQRRQLEQLFMHAPAAICILSGPNLVYELVNPPYQQLFPGRQLQGRPIAEALPELVGLQVHETFLRVYRTGITTQEQAMLIPIAHPTTGLLEDRYFNYIQQARFDEQERPDGVLVFAFEVTQQVLALRASEALARRLQLLTDALPVLVSYVDRERRYQFANESYRRWFDRDPATLLGQPVRTIIGEAAYANAARYMDRVLAGERLTFETQMPYRTGFVRHIHTDYIPDLRQGQAQGFYALITDITDQVTAREQVQELNEELAATNEELLDANTRLQHTNVDLDTFVYTASHDLKAPISNIEGLLTALRHQLPAAVVQDAEVAYLLDLMHGAVARFQHTIGHLTDISKLQHAHAEPAEEVDLPALIEALRLDLAPALAAARGQLSVALCAVRTLRFSPKNLRSILYNLLSNAIKYHQPDRPALVLLRAHRTPGHLVIEVQDNGLGLSAEQQAGLFIMFHRLHTHVEGSGVGLYMVKRIVENAGGSIRVQSEVGAGSTFTVVLPEG
jgi:PAS domain S-box-containing protein